MSVKQSTDYRQAFGALRQYVDRAKPVEHCELCGANLPDRHSHMLEPVARKLFCACQACVVLSSGRGDARYKRVPHRVLFLADFQITDAEWDGMLIPIGMAFFFKSSPEAKTVALYPGPGGVTESLLSLDTWNDIAMRNPLLTTMESDVEALLVNRLGPSRGFADAEYYLMPIDECYRLVGLIRSRWQGLSGGSEVWEELRHFFEGLKKQSEAIAEGSYA